MSHAAVGLKNMSVEMTFGGRVQLRFLLQFSKERYYNNRTVLGVDLCHIGSFVPDENEWITF